MPPRTSASTQDVDGRVLGDQGVEDVHDGRREPALREAARALHEQDDGVLGDELVDLLLDLPGRAPWVACMASSTISVRAVRVDRRGRPARPGTALDHGPSPFLRHGFLRALEESGSIGGTGESAAAGRPSTCSPSRRRSSSARSRPSSRTTATASTSSTGAGRARRSAPGIRYYPKLVDRGARDPRDRQADACSRPARRRASPSALIAAVRAGRRRHRVLVDPLAVLHRRGAGACSRTPATSRATRSSSTGTTAATRSFDDFLGAAQEPQAQAAPQGAREGAGRDRAADVGRGRRARSGAARRSRSVLSHHDRQPRRPRLPAPRLLPRARRSTLPEAMRMVEVDRGRQADRGRAVPRDRPRRSTAATGAPTRTSICCTSRPRTTPASSARSRSRLPLFEAGAQGEHKLLRGFEPSPTYSAHWIRHPGLAAAIADLLRARGGGDGSTSSPRWRSTARIARDNGDDERVESPPWPTTTRAPARATRPQRSELRQRRARGARRRRSRRRSRCPRASRRSRSARARASLL